MFSFRDVFAGVASSFRTLLDPFTWIVNPEDDQAFEMLSDESKLSVRAQGTSSVMVATDHLCSGSLLGSVSGLGFDQSARIYTRRGEACDTILVVPLNVVPPRHLMVPGGFHVIVHGNVDSSVDVQSSFPIRSTSADNTQCVPTPPVHEITGLTDLLPRIHPTGDLATEWKMTMNNFTEPDALEHDTVFCAYVRNIIEVFDSAMVPAQHASQYHEHHGASSQILQLSCNDGPRGTDPLSLTNVSTLSEDLTNLMDAVFTSNFPLELISLDREEGNQPKFHGTDEHSSCTAGQNNMSLSALETPHEQVSVNDTGTESHDPGTLDQAQRNSRIAKIVRFMESVEAYSPYTWSSPNYDQSLVSSDRYQPACLEWESFTPPGSPQANWTTPETVRPSEGSFMPPGSRQGTLPTPEAIQQGEDSGSEWESISSGNSPTGCYMTPETGLMEGRNIHHSSTALDFTPLLETMAAEMRARPLFPVPERTPSPCELRAARIRKASVELSDEPNNPPVDLLGEPNAWTPGRLATEEDKQRHSRFEEDGLYDIVRFRPLNPTPNRARMFTRSFLDEIEESDSEQSFGCKLGMNRAANHYDPHGYLIEPINKGRQLDWSHAHLNHILRHDSLSRRVEVADPFRDMEVNAKNEPIPDTESFGGSDQLSNVPEALPAYRPWIAEYQMQPSISTEDNSQQGPDGVHRSSESDTGAVIRHSSPASHVSDSLHLHYDPTFTGSYWRAEEWPPSLVSSDGDESWSTSSSSSLRGEAATSTVRSNRFRFDHEPELVATGENTQKQGVRGGSSYHGESSRNVARDEMGLGFVEGTPPITVSRLSGKPEHPITSPTDNNPYLRDLENEFGHERHDALERLESENPAWNSMDSDHITWEEQHPRGVEGSFSFEPEPSSFALGTLMAPRDSIEEELRGEMTDATTLPTQLPPSGIQLTPMGRRCLRRSPQVCENYLRTAYRGSNQGYT